MTSRFLLPATFALLVLLSLASCKKDDGPTRPPEVLPPCATHESVLTRRHLTLQISNTALNTRYEYDAARRLVRIVDSPSQIQTSFAYGADGLQIVATCIVPGPDTTVTTYIFNSVGYLTRKTIVPLRDTTLARREEFAYDGSGRLLRRNAYDGPAFAHDADKLEYYWLDGNITGYSFYAAPAGSTQIAEHEYFSDMRGTAVTAGLPEADLLFALGKPYRIFPKNILRKTVYQYSSGGGGGSITNDVTLDAGGRILSFKKTSWGSFAPTDSTRLLTEYGYECR